MQSESFVEALEATIDYLQSGYADVTISSIASETEYISPAAGNYTKDYRKSDKIKLSFVPNEKYVFVKWSATPEESITFEDATSLDTTATVESVENPITITPVVVPKGVLRVTFKADQGSIIPAEEHDYYLDDEFTIRYTEVSDYAFTGWNAYDASGNDVTDYLQIESTSTLETTCKVLKTDSKITLEATNAKRPKVLSMAPAYNDSGVDKDSSIKIVFSQTMSDSALYWTEEELKAAGITNSVWYSSYKTTIDNVDYYWAYDEDCDSTKQHYKNISISNRETTENLLNHFGCPYFADTRKSIVIIPCLGNGVTGGIEVEVTVELSFSSKTGISLSGEYVSCYLTNDSIDITPPVISISNVVVNGQTLKQTTASNSQISEEMLINEYISKNKSWLSEEPWSLPDLEPVDNKMKVTIEGFVKDTGSKPQAVELILEPAVTALTQVQQNQLIYKTEVPSLVNQIDKQTCKFGEEEDALEFEIPWGSEYFSGGYRLSFRAYDNKGNASDKISVMDKYWTFVYKDSKSTVLNETLFTIPEKVTYSTTGDTGTLKSYAVDFDTENTLLRIDVNQKYDRNNPNKLYGIWKTANDPYNIYSDVSKQWPILSGDLENPDLIIQARDIFGNDLVTYDNKTQISKSIQVNDYPMISYEGKTLQAHYKYTNSGSGSEKYDAILSFDISELCSEIRNIHLLILTEDENSANWLRPADNNGDGKYANSTGYISSVNENFEVKDGSYGVGKDEKGNPMYRFIISPKGKQTGEKIPLQISLKKLMNSKYNSDFFNQDLKGSIRFYFRIFDENRNMTRLMYLSDEHKTSDWTMYEVFLGSSREYERTITFIETAEKFPDENY